MEIHQLEYVMAVVKYHHFSYAANIICISQSTLSQQIKKLEEELGVSLFERSTRQVKLTPAGREFAGYAARILEQIYQSRKAMQQYSVAERGEIVLGAIPIIGMLGLVSILADFQKEHPNIHLFIKEAGGETLLEELEKASIDVAFFISPQDDNTNENLQLYPLITDDLVLLVYKAHPLSGKRWADLKSLKDERFIFMSSDNGMFRVNVDVCQNAGFMPKVVFQSSQVDTIAALVGEGLGITILSYSVAKHVKTAAHTIVRIKDAPKKITVLALRKQAVITPALKVFCQFVLERFKQ